MTEPLDKILSGRGEAVSEQPEQQVTQQPEAQAQPEEPATTQEAEKGEVQTKMVPHEALHAEKQKVKRYTDEVAEFRKTNEALQRQVTELLQRVPVPKQEQQAPPDFYENPQAATQHTVSQFVGPHLDQFSQALMANAQLVASVKYGDEKVQEAEQAFIEAVQSRTVDPADYQKVVNSPNRYAAAVQWHQRRLAQQEIGDDPAAYRAKIEAEIRAKYGLPDEPQGNGQPPQAAVMPSNLATARNVGARTGPAWSGPPGLADIFNRKRSPAT